MNSKGACCVIVPTHNEGETVGILIDQLFDHVGSRLDYQLRVVIVDGESSDNTPSVLASRKLKYPFLTVLSAPKSGLGHAYLLGFKYAIANLEPEIVVQMDGDLQHDPAALPALVDACSESNGVSIGSRFVPGASTPGLGPHRRYLSLAAGWMIHRGLAVSWIADYTSGYRCIRAAALKERLKFPIEAQGYAFQTSLLVGLMRAGCKPVEVPITFNKRVAGKSKLTSKDLIGFISNLRRLRRETTRRQPLKARDQAAEAKAANAAGGQ